MLASLRSRKRLHSSFILHTASLSISPSSSLLPLRRNRSQPPEFTGIRVGLGDRYKTGLWTPVELKIRGGSESLTGIVSVTVPDGDGIPSQVVTPPNKPCQVLPGRETTVRLFVRFGRVRSELQAEFIVDDGKVAAQQDFRNVASRR